MFDLEEAIKIWRRSLRKNESLEDGYMEELESHLRDKIEHLAVSGLSVEQAFEEAVEKIGDRDHIGEEYFKADTKNRSGRPPWKPSKFFPALISNYFKIAFRKVRRQKIFSLINIAGLAVGLACCAVIILYVTNELTYDHFHPDADRIFRISSRRISEVGDNRRPTTPGLLAPTLKRDFPQVEEVTRVVPPYENADNVLVVKGDNRFFESRVWFVDDSAPRVFRIPFLQGSPDKALIRPHSAVITEAMAQKYFGDETPLGKILQIEIDYDMGDTQLEDYEVTGIVRNVPLNTHFKYDMLLSIATHISHQTRFEEDLYGFHRNLTYVKLAAKADPLTFEKQIQRVAVEEANVYKERRGRELALLEYFLEPVASIHMKSPVDIDIDPRGNWYYIYIYSMVAFLILLIGCMNFINLSAALSATRTREVGLRKVIGAQRRQLIWQFLGESSLITFLAFLLSLVLMTALLGPFNRMAGTELTIAALSNPVVFVPMIFLLFLVAIGSGAYPAFILTAFRPADVLQGKLAPTTRGNGVQRVLVIGQFAISIFLVICTMTVFKQLNFMRGQALGFDMEQKVILRVKSNLPHLRNDYESIKQDFLVNPAIKGVTVSSSVPGDRDDGGYYMTTREEDFSDNMRLKVITVDYDFIKEYGLKMIAGRSFRKDIKSDPNEAFIINRAGLTELGIASPEEAIGKRYQAHYHRKWKTIIGVTENFHFRGMKDVVDPQILDIEPSLMDTVSLTVETKELSSVLRHIRKTWDVHFSGVPYEYAFLDDNFAQVYRYESQMGKLLGITTTLGLIISCLGLFGLAYFVVNFRRKEIGIRRVLGASTGDVVGMLAKRFALLILVSVVVAGPLAWYAMNRWLRDFAYRVDLGWFVFAAAALGALFIAMATVSVQGLRAAHVNPANSLRNE